jgi:hypothetical protein
VGNGASIPAMHSPEKLAKVEEIANIEKAALSPQELLQKIYKLETDIPDVSQYYRGDDKNAILKELHKQLHDLKETLAASRK